jgi:hypothetical protein
MSFSFEYKNNAWTITDVDSGFSLQADQVIADLEFVRGPVLRGKVVIAHGVNMKQVSSLRAQDVHAFGIHAPTHRMPPPPRWARRYRLMEGGRIEPFTN